MKKHDILIVDKHILRLYGVLGSEEEMENSNIVVVKKKHTVWKIIGIILAVGALCLVAARVYQKFFKKKCCKAEELDAEDELAAVEPAEEADETFEVPAEAVIANAEDME